MNGIYSGIYNFPIGKLRISANDSAITGIDFDTLNSKNSNNTNHPNKIVVKAKNQLDEYFACKRIKFDLPLHFNGTDFQIATWNALLKIPYGETRSYKDIAISIGNPKGVRAVGLANNKNPIAIIIPCHRVIGANGTLVGYAGGLTIKQYLLKLEKAT